MCFRARLQPYYTKAQGKVQDFQKEIEAGIKFQHCLLNVISHDQLRDSSDLNLSFTKFCWPHALFLWHPQLPGLISLKIIWIRCLHQTAPSPSKSNLTSIACTTYHFTFFLKFIWILWPTLFPTATSSNPVFSLFQLDSPTPDTNYLLSVKLQAFSPGGLSKNTGLPSRTKIFSPSQIQQKALTLPLRSN